MNRDEVLKIAHETGCIDEQHYGSLWTERLERFAAAIYSKGFAAGAESNQPQLVALARYIQHQQAKIDALMLEYCPDEMTEEQIAEWEKHQRSLPITQTNQVEGEQG